MECRKCLNSTKNPAIKILENGLCEICDLYKSNFNAHSLKEEKELFDAFVGKGKKYDIMAGISGGKDSSAMLYTLKKMGFRPLAFTFDIGYYPRHEFLRASEVANELGVDHVVIKIQKYLNNNDLVAYKRTAELYSRNYSKKLKEDFMRIYSEGHKYYSVRTKSSRPVVRTCQLCRRAVIRAYYREAKIRGIPVVALAMNEWAGLSQDYKNHEKYKFSSIRLIKPNHMGASISVVHVPFMLQRKLPDTLRILDRMGWLPPKGERLVESNANSCLFAKAAESKAKRLLGFHPDTPRISREITVGFITRKQGMAALNETHKSRKSVRQVLEESGIFRSVYK